MEINEGGAGEQQPTSTELASPNTLHDFASALFNMYAVPASQLEDVLVLYPDKPTRVTISRDRINQVIPPAPLPPPPFAYYIPTAGGKLTYQIISKLLQKQAEHLQLVLTWLLADPEYHAIEFDSGFQYEQYPYVATSVILGRHNKRDYKPHAILGGEIENSILEAGIIEQLIDLEPAVMVNTFGDIWQLKQGEHGE